MIAQLAVALCIAAAAYATQPLPHRRGWAMRVELWWRYARRQAKEALS